MADPELAALRAARLSQLQKSGADGNGPTVGGSEDAEKRRAEEQMRRDLLATALEPAARERRMSLCLLCQCRLVMICISKFHVSHSYPLQDPSRLNPFSFEWRKRDSFGEESTKSN
jgi:hypothetical protein